MDYSSAPLLAEINSFLAESRMSASYFGKRAAGNSELVDRLSRGKTITLQTAERVRAFMAARRNQPETT